MRRFGAVAVVGVALAGCGSSAPTKHAARHAGPSAKIVAAQQLVRDTAAAQYYTPGRPQVQSAVCRGTDQLVCTFTYGVTAPTGQRHRLRATVPVNCQSASSCTADWSGVSRGVIIANLGMDPGSHVARCEKALRASITAFTSPSADYATAVACEGVSHGVYTGRVQRTATSRFAGAYPVVLQRRLLDGCAAQAPASFPLGYCECAVHQTEMQLLPSNPDFHSSPYVLGTVLVRDTMIRHACQAAK